MQTISDHCKFATKTDQGSGGGKYIHLNKLPFHIPKWGRIGCSGLEVDRTWYTDKAEVSAWTGSWGMGMFIHIPPLSWYDMLDLFSSDVQPLDAEQHILCLCSMIIFLTSEG